MLVNGASVEMSRQTLTRLLVSSDEMSPCASRSRTSVTDRRLITDLSTTPYDQKDLSVSCQTFTSVELLTTKTAGPLKRPSSSTIASLHDITGLLASCYKSHRPETSNLSVTTTLFGFYHLTLTSCLKFFHYSVESPYWLSSRDVIFII